MKNKNKFTLETFIDTMTLIKFIIYSDKCNYTYIIQTMQ